MDAIKSVVGLGKKEQEGQEPVSGVKGQGTAGEPFDQGNQEGSAELGGKAPQETNAGAVTGDAPTDSKADEATTSGKSEAAPASAAVPPTSTTSDSETSKAHDSSSKPKIGSPSWFKTAIPIGKHKSEPQQTSAGAAAKETAETASGLPPNHLGEDVPPGRSEQDDQLVATMADHSTPSALNPSEDPQARAADGEAQAAAREPPQIAVSNAENHAPQQEEKKSGGGLFSNPFKSVGNTDDVSTSTAAKRRSSREAPGSNPNAIPTAGGVRIGSIAYERRMSTVPQRKSQDQPKIHEPVFEEQTNHETPATAAAATNGVKPVEEEEKIKDSTDASAASETQAPPALNTTSAETPRSSSVGSPNSEKSSRRKSIFGKVKEKLR